MQISEKAVEAACRAYYEIKPFNGLDNSGPVPWDKYKKSNVSLVQGESAKMRAALSAALSAQGPKDQPVAGLQYRPNDFDDWGVIRTENGDLFAVVRSPISTEEAHEHRANKTDPFEGLARKLIAALSPSPAQEAGAEPAGWLHENPKFGKEITFDSDISGLEERYGWVKTPLYTLPPALDRRGEWEPHDESWNVDAELEEFLDGVTGVVHATSFEVLCLWQEYQWKDQSNPRGLWINIGKFGGMPVCVSLRTEMVHGEKLLFVDTTSRIVDHTRVEEWLDKVMPASARRNSRVNRVDAMNFHNIFPSAASPSPKEERDSAAQAGKPKDLRHECAKSGFHDHDGCSCSDAELLARDDTAGKPDAPQAVPIGLTFQERVEPWMMACFGPEISADKLERNDRFIEEALELVQAGDYPKERVLALVDYVYGRDQGDINQEVGGVLVTLAAHCLAHGVDMHAAAETELARVWTKIDKIRAKQAAKPTGSALPVAAPTAGGEDE